MRLRKKTIKKQETLPLEYDVQDLKGIKVGDWVESSCLKGYFKVCQIKHGYRDGKYIGYILLLKKVFTSTMKFSFATEKCHVIWCKKLRENQICEIEKLLEENPTKKKKFDELPLLFPCIQELFFLDIKKEQIESFREKLKGLPRYFTSEEFYTFVKQAGWQKYIKANSNDPQNAITLTIYTQDWIVDLNKNMLFCNPQIGNSWGTLAKLDEEKWSDYK